MRRCQKCGESTKGTEKLCLHCGCVLRNYDVEAKLERSDFKPTVIPTDTKRLWLLSMLGGLGYGVFMSVVTVAMIGGAGVAIGLGSGVLFGVLFGGAMTIATSAISKKFDDKRVQISKRNRIVVEGAATMNGAGGWLFITDAGVEFYTHKLNWDHKSLTFSHNDVQSITKQGKLLVTVANQTQYKFVVHNVDMWLSAINCL